MRSISSNLFLSPKNLSFYKFIKITHRQAQHRNAPHSLVRIVNCGLIPQNWIIRCNLSIDFYRVPSVAAAAAAVDIAFVVNAFFVG